MASRKNRGFTLVETLVGSFIFVLVSVVAYQAFTVLMQAVQVAQAKVAAASVANEKFEIIRNLPYTDVGIVGGLPLGKITRTQNVTRDGYTFNVLTTIRSVDDPFDGTIGGTLSDLSPADYKMVQLDITCPICKTFPPLKFNTLVASKGLETASTNGALFLQVFDAAGAGIANTSVHIVNAQTNPFTIIDESTDDTGWIRVVDAPPGTNAYNISVTKPGYSTDQTYPVNGAAGPNPIKTDSTVVLKQITQISLSIDRLSILNVTTVNDLCVAVPNVGFSLTGTKNIGNPSVLKYPVHTFTTDPAGGTLSIPNMEWDAYKTLLTSPAYDLAGANIQANFNLDPNETKVLQLIAVPHLGNALLVSVVDSTGASLDGYTALLKKTGFSQSKSPAPSGICGTPGQVFWNGLSAGTYTLTVSKPGFTSNVSSVTASTWQNKTIILTP